MGVTESRRDQWRCVEDPFGAGLKKTETESMRGDVPLTAAERRAPLGGRMRQAAVRDDGQADHRQDHRATNERIETSGAYLEHFFTPARPTASRRHDGRGQRRQGV